MNRDRPSEACELIPPPDPRSVYRTIGIGIASIFVGAVLSLIPISEPGPLSTTRLFLVAIGALIAGSGLSQRPGLPLAWLLASFAALLAYPALPAHWDSARLLAGVLASVALIASALTALQPRWRYALISTAAVVHFGGILCATTWPDPTPWVTQQIGTRVYLPYLMFMYLRNAYHFYSPEPGPASHLFCLVVYKEKDPKTGKNLAEWRTLPDRAKHWKDPLGLTYYRRLAITEQASQTIPDLGGPTTFEKRDVYERRQKAAGGLGGFSDYPRIPLAPDDFEPASLQYRMPRPDITRYLLPSYARHVIKEAEADTRPVQSVKIYRLEHRLTPVRAFAAGANPHFPTTFRPYFLGEFKYNSETDEAELADPQDPMLYWLVPILPRVPSAGDSNTKEYEDFMSKHAGYTYNWEARMP